MRNNVSLHKPPEHSLQCPKARAQEAARENCAVGCLLPAFPGAAGRLCRDADDGNPHRFTAAGHDCTRAYGRPYRSPRSLRHALAPAQPAAHTNPPAGPHAYTSTYAGPSPGVLDSQYHPGGTLQ